MSLNGLDDPKVVEAHQAGVAEPGGWFLLKYSSRDEVELLEKGNGGIVEMRNAIAGFEEESPLYGFLRYRRRNVIVKYLPEDCSRLIQARVAVHFNAVCERFSPYDTIFEISTASELRDTKLSAACSLHAASGSTASSVSSRRRRLGEIAEEDEDEQRSPKRQSLELSDDDRPRTPGNRSTAADEVKLNSELASSPEHRKFSTASTSEVPKFVGVPDAPPSPTRSFDTTDSYNYYPVSKPKVKLAPRPTTDVTIRPKASGSFRPVSSLPAGIRFGKSGRKGRGKDDDAASSIHEDIPELELPADSTTGTTPGGSRRPSADSSRPSTAAGSSADTLSVPVVPAKPTMTPEKARLMKAMKLREKKKKQQQQQQQQQLQQQQLQQKQSADGAESGVDTAGPEDDKAITGEDDGKKKDMTHSEETTVEDHAVNGNNGREAGEENTQEKEQKKKSNRTEDAATSISQADSGVVLDSLSSSVQIDEVSEGTRSESRPQSPAVDSYEHDQSTTASSLSDSTDETLHAQHPDEVTTAGAKVDDATATAAADGSAVVVADQNEANRKPAVATIPNPVAPVQELHEDEMGRVAEVDTRASPLSPPDATAVPPAVSADAASSFLEESETTSKADGTKQTEIEASSSTALEPDHEIAAAGAANNKGSAKAENEKEKKGIAEPISSLSAYMPMSKAPPAALLDGLGSGAGEIPLGATPGDVAQATDKGGQGLEPELQLGLAGVGAGAGAGAAAAAAAPPSPSTRASTQDLVDAANAAAAAHTTVATPAMELELQTDPLPLPAAHEAIPAAATASDAAAPPDQPSDADEAQKTQQQQQQQPSREQDERASRPGALPRPIASSSGDDDALVVQEAAAAGPLLPSPAAPTAHLPAAAASAAAAAAAAPPPPLQGRDAAAHRHDQPMVATKSPLTPVFPSAPIANGPLGARAPPAHTVRTVSNPVRGNFIAPTDVTQSTARSLSSGAAFLHKVTQQQSASLATMKPNVGSSISQRIKALEKLSATSGDQSRPVSRERPSSTFFAVQKRDTSRAPSVVDRTRSLHGRAASPTPSYQDDALEGRVRLQRSGSVVSRVSMFEPLAAVASSAASASSPPPGLAPGTQSRGRPESIAITTKFAGYELPPKDASSEYGGYQSPLTAADYLRGDEGSERRPRSLERRGEDDMASRTTTVSPSSASHRLSMSSRRSITLDRDGLANSSVTEDSFSGDESSPSDRKTSRAGRFMRKLSNLSSGSKNKASSPSPEVTRGAAAGGAQAQTSSTSTAQAASGDASIVSDLGDVNVQFPDSLLWKRRNLCLDSHGCIILSTLPAQSSRMAQGTKKYHMGEFRQPYTPDVEVQELPNSVVLDFVEGTGIQLACEDRTGQLNVLHVLQAAHANHSR